MACVGNGFAQTLSIQSGSTIGAAQADSIVQIAAESQGLAQVAPADLPIIGGTFWWVMPGGAAVPAPCPPLDLSGAIYQIAEGQFLVDETGGQVVANTPRFGLQAQATSSTVASEVASQVDALVNLITRVQTAAANQQVWTMARAMGMDVPSPGSDGGSGDGSDYTSSYVPYIFDTNGLWLEITGVSNGQVDLNLHNPTNEVYAIWCTTNLLGNWNVETELWPTPDQTNVLPFTVANLDRQNLFVRAEDWTGVDSDGDGIPDWWIWFYFGNLSETATNLDSQDNTLLYDYTNGLDPNVIQFTLSTASQYINTLTVPVQINLLAGVPSYYAVLVNDINQADANWQTFPGTNITVILGSTNGVYTVSVGLRGLPPNATATWQTVQLTLNTIAPTVVITNPAAGVVSQPMIQVQGFANEALSHVTFDVSNATGIFTNQTGYITSQYYDANLLTFTTNYFQCYDVPLTNGLNTISVHTTDLAGNTTTTNVNFILDYSNATNPPVLTVVWPQDGTYISGSSFTFEGQVDDDTASVTATIVDASGDTNTVQGLVERSGAVWAQNLPLAAGTNILMISATDAAGNTSTTNLTLYQSSVIVTVNPLAGDQLNRQFVTVMGTVSDTTVQVYVNGVQATVNDDGTWEADSVPVSPAGMAKLDVEIFSSGSSPAIVRAAKTGLTFRANDDSTAGNLGSQLGINTQPARVVLSGYFGTRHYQSPTNLAAYLPVNVSWNEDDEVYWTCDAGGGWYFYATDLVITTNGNYSDVSLFSYDLNLFDPSLPGNEPLPLSPDTDGFKPATVDTDAEWAWLYDGWSEPPVTLSLPITDGPGLNFVNPPWEFSALNAHIGSTNPYSLQRDTRTTVMIVPSLPAVSGQTNVYLVRVAAREFSDPLNPNVFGPATVNYNLLMFAPYPYPTTWDVPAGWDPGWLPTTPTRYLGDVPLPPEWLQINGQTLINSGVTNADGSVWGYTLVTAHSGATVDVTPTVTHALINNDYTFRVEVIQLKIFANGIDLSTNTPEFCVGQAVTNQLIFDPPLPNGTQIKYQWVASLDFVNSALPPVNPDGSSYPDIDPSMLTNNPTPIWWYNGGYKYIWCTATVQLPNGQTATVVDEGNVSIYTPQVQFADGSPAFPMLYNGYMELGDENLQQGNMTFAAKVTSTNNFPGTANWTQLNNRYASYPNGGQSTDGQFWLDNSEFYNDGIGNDFPPTPVNPIGTVPFQDAPGVSDVYPLESITDSFETYLVFQPAPQNSSIWVTLGIVTWGWSATESAWSLTATNVTQATYSDSDKFPTWLHTGHNSRGN
ncbi:MAG: hypothetical protein ABSC89_06295 [Verrucomicrobiota bacterium]